MATLAMLVAAPRVALALLPRVSSPLYRALVGGAPAPAWLAAIAIVAFVLLWVVPIGSSALRLPRTLAMAWLVALYAVAAAMPWWAEALQGPVARAADAARALRAQEPTLRVVQSGLNQPSFAWRYGDAVPHAEPRVGDVVLIRLDRPLAGRSRTLFSERGIALQRVEAP